MCVSQILEEVTRRAEESETIKEEVEKVRDKAQALVNDIAKDKSLAEEKLEAARPALEEAEAALNTIKPAHIGNHVFWCSHFMWIFHKKHIKYREGFSRLHHWKGWKNEDTNLHSILKNLPSKASGVLGECSEHIQKNI